MLRKLLFVLGSLDNSDCDLRGCMGPMKLCNFAHGSVVAISECQMCPGVILPEPGLPCSREGL